MYGFKNNFKQSNQKKVRISDSNVSDFNQRSTSPVQNVEIIKEDDINERGQDQSKYDKKEYRTSSSQRRRSPEYRRNHSEIDSRRRKSSRNRHSSRGHIRTYIIDRRPFDWYDMRSSKLLHEYQEIYVPERYSRVDSYGSYYDQSNRYDDYDVYDRPRDYRKYRSMSRRRESSESDYSEPRPRSIIKKKEIITRQEYEDQRADNMFAVSEQRSPILSGRQKNVEIRDLTDLTDEFSEVSIEDYRPYKNLSRRY